LTSFAGNSARAGAGLPDSLAITGAREIELPDRRMAIELGDETHVGTLVLAGIELLGNGTTMAARTKRRSDIPPADFICASIACRRASISGTRWAKTAASRSAFVPK